MNRGLRGFLATASPPEWRTRMRGRLSESSKSEIRNKFELSKRGSAYARATARQGMIKTGTFPILFALANEQVKFQTNSNHRNVGTTRTEQFRIFLLGHLVLFRISNFGFRVFRPRAGLLQIVNLDQTDAGAAVLPGENGGVETGW